MKSKVFKVLLLTFLMVFLAVPAAFAQSNGSTNLKNFHVNFNKDLGSHGRTYATLVKEMLNQGVAPNDAHFYAKMDILMHQLNVQHVKLNMKRVKAVSKSYARLHPNEVRQRALHLDLPALMYLASRKCLKRQLKMYHLPIPIILLPIL